jgi:UDP-N-acetyl-D-galactosamine dehydrogenase
MSEKIGVVGLGYVGLPVALSFAKKYSVVAFDVDSKRVGDLREGYDKNKEYTKDELLKNTIQFSNDGSDLSTCKTIIVAVPTPIDRANKPDLSILASASRLVGENLTAGATVVFESTVYPGATEEVCIPELESASGLRWKTDFHVGYSPERINPGNKEHTFETINKIVSGDDSNTTENLAKLYGSVIQAEIHKAPSIKVGEAAKVIENTQRDLNIALMNELSLIFDKLGIDTMDVLRAAGTKWNFLPFRPGLVGGHCIGVDPFYLTHKAESVGYRPEVILSGRRINDTMGAAIASKVIKKLIATGETVLNSKVIVLGLTFKENVSDLRNSKVLNVVQELESFGVDVQLHDPVADPDEVRKIFGKKSLTYDELGPSKAVILCVAHDFYRENQWQGIEKLFDGKKGIFADIKSVFEPNEIPESIQYWRL